MHDTVETILKELLASMGIKASVARSDAAGQAIFSVVAEDPADARALIGAHGDTVHALDMIVKKMVEKRLPEVDSRDQIGRASCRERV